MFSKLVEKIFEDRKKGKATGVTSYCIANPLAIQSVLLHGTKNESPLLFEATSNQVNQYGGYTGMTPDVYRQRVLAIAQKVGFPKERLLFGGDHLGPLPFSSQPAKVAMKKAEGMIDAFVRAGYEKIHLDTSMHLGDDDQLKPLPKSLVADRGAQLMKVALQSYVEYKKEHPAASHPMFVIGSEVPPAGGQSAESDKVEITAAEHVSETLDAYREAFSREGLEETWKYVIALVVQPGVEYGNHEIIQYDSEKAKNLMGVLDSHDRLIYEGHSTDYQTRDELLNMVADGVAILKVGPAVTMALREALVNLEEIEQHLILDEEKWSCFSQELEHAMKKSPSNWSKYYSGSEEEIRISRKFSLLDRSRYYLGDENVKNSVDKLLLNLDAVNIPPGLIRHYFPMQFRRLNWSGTSAIDLIVDYVGVLVEDYDYATMEN